MVSLPHHPPTERNKLVSLDKISSDKMTSLQTEIGDRCQQGRIGKPQRTAPTLGPGLVGSNWSDGGSSPLQDKAVVGNCGKYAPGEKHIPSENQRLGKTDKYLPSEKHIPSENQRLGKADKYLPSEKRVLSENQRLGKADKVQGLASCPHSGAGCAWHGAPGDLPGHLATQVVAYSAI